MGYKIWCNLSFTDAQSAERQRLIDGLNGHEVTFLPPSDTGRAGESSEQLLEADIAFGSPDADMIIKSSRLKWAHIFSAGYTDYDREDLRNNFFAEGKILTNSSDVFVEPCAEHVAAMMLAIARRLPDALDNQRKAERWPIHEIRNKASLLLGQKVVIYGFGTIGRRLAELLAPFKMDVVGVKRTAANDVNARVVTITDADDELADTDHVVNILPSSGETQSFFDADRFGIFKPGAVFYNIGRGTTTDSYALLAALEVGRLSAAYLDVTDPEPLPQGHPLWTTENCYITPHTAGGAMDEKIRQVDHFLANLKRFDAGTEMANRIC